MVSIDCWCCDKNTGNKTCTEYPNGIVEGAWRNCKAFVLIAKEKRIKQLKEHFPFGWDVPDE